MDRLLLLIISACNQRKVTSCLLHFRGGEGGEFVRGSFIGTYRNVKTLKWTSNKLQTLFLFFSVHSSLVVITVVVVIANFISRYFKVHSPYFYL